MLDVVSRTARCLFIPFTVGGGIRELADAEAVFEAGADKIAINSAAVKDSTLIGKIAARFGSQAVVVAIDAARKRRSRWLRGIRCRRAHSHRPGRDFMGAGSSRLRRGRNHAHFDGPRRDQGWFRL
jgi:imidazole glycerol phosphate synthase subunit HisF